jgi:hypothetical protein
LRAPEEILADAVAATGGAAAWNAHKTLHFKMETTLQGMGMGGTGERFQTRGDKALTIMEMAGLGRVREGNNGKVAWTEDPVQGIRYLEGVEAEQTRIASSWNMDMHVGELFPGFRVVSCSAFRVTRNSDLTIDEDEAADLLKTIQKELRRRDLSLTHTIVQPTTDKALGDAPRDPA